MTTGAGAATGFSAMAAEYDALAKTNPVVAWMRRRIRQMAERYLPPGGSMLEINAGSGLDALYFAQRGFRVHATDVAPGMLEALAEKAARPEAGGLITYEALSFTELEKVRTGPYDLVFSNLGGLNCTADLGTVGRGLAKLLRPGGVAVLVVMPPVCPWELAQAARGHWRTAGRRLAREGVLAHVGGGHVRTWYHSPGRLQRALGPAFHRLELRSFCLFAPPSFFQGFIGRHPRVVRALMRVDDSLGGLPPFNRCGDFYALTVRFRP